MAQIAIIGGGIGGLTTAHCLRQAGFEAEIFEQAPVLLDVGAAIALWPNAMRVLNHLGLGEQILEKAGIIREIHWLDPRGSLINKVNLPKDEFASAPAVALHRADLQSTLLRTLPANSVHLGNSLVEPTTVDNRIVAQFANGNSFAADLLIAADGVHSRTRTCFNKDVPPTYRGYSVWRGIASVVPSSIPPATAVEIQGKGKRFGIGPVGLGRLGWWATANAANTSAKVEERSGDRTIWQHGETVVSTRSKDTQRELLRMFDGWYRPVLQLIESTPSSSVLRTGAYDRRSSGILGRGRITLLGDATHPMTPNLGQGGCMAIEDAEVLARCVAKYGTTETALRSYERLRQKRTAAVVRYSRWYGGLGQSELLPTRVLRRTMISLWPEETIRKLMRIVFDYDAVNLKI